MYAKCIAAHIERIRSLSGEVFDVADIIMFLVKTAMMAWALGMFLGYFFFTWIRLAANKLEHNSGMIQIALTICCAYWSFIIVEVEMIRQRESNSFFCSATKRYFLL